MSFSRLVPLDSPSVLPRIPATARDLGLAAVLGLLLLALAGCGSRSADAPGATTRPADAKGPGSTSVIAVAARRADMPIYFTGLGSVAGLNTATIRTRVDGELVKVAFTEGQIVHAGDLLAQIDPRPFQVQLGQAQGQLAKDQAILENARLDLQRFKLAEDAASQQQVDTQLSLVKQNEGVVKIDEAQINSIKLQLTYCDIIAPFTGRIGLRMVDQGNLVHASDAGGLAVITQLQPISLLFTLPQDNIPRLMQRMNTGAAPSVEAYDRDMTNRIAVGTLTAIDNQVDPSSGTIRLKATFSNEDNSLFPNQFVNARLLVDLEKDAVIIPSAAVQQGPNNMKYVYVVKAADASSAGSDQVPAAAGPPSADSGTGGSAGGGHGGGGSPTATVEVREVVTGPTEADQVCIEKGLEANEVVVTDGVDKLKDGSKVTARTESPKSGGAAGTGAGGGGGKGWGKHRRKDAGKSTSQPATQPADAKEGA